MIAHTEETEYGKSTGVLCAGQFGLTRLFNSTGRSGLEHVPKKLLDFFEKGMLQLFDFELRPYRSNDSI